MSQMLFQAKAAEIPKAFLKNWEKKSTFFGVNQAWDYLPQRNTVLTYYAREKLRPFPMNKFPEKEYRQKLTKLRNEGLKYAGIKDWKIEKMKIQKLDRKRILIKVSGTYQRESGAVYFHEWQLFDGHLYHQVNLVEDVTPKANYVKNKEREKVFKGVLEL